MKKIINNILFVQRIDLLYLGESHIPVPESIYKKIKFNIDDRNKYNFVMFNSKEDILFLNSIPWIIDYDEVKDLSEANIQEMIDNNLNERKDLNELMTKNTGAEKLHQYIEIQSLDLKIQSLRDALWYKKGMTKMNIPTSPKRRKRNKH